MISNPCSWFSGGGSSSDIKTFAYEGGKYLYHFDCSGHESDQIRTGWTGNWIPVNVIFFANDEDHARDVFRRMLEFRIECAREQILFYEDSKKEYAHSTEFKSRVEREQHMTLDWLSRINEAVFTLAPTNQLYSVGWASNDNILG